MDNYESLLQRFTKMMLHKFMKIRILFYNFIQ
jgi:hypothetical protein